MAADFNGDGRMDLAAATWMAGVHGIDIFLNQGGLLFAGALLPVAFGGLRHRIGRFQQGRQTGSRHDQAEPTIRGWPGAFACSSGTATAHSRVRWRPNRRPGVREPWWSAISTMTATRTSRQATGPR